MGLVVSKALPPSTQKNMRGVERVYHSRAQSTVALALVFITKRNYTNPI